MNARRVSVQGSCRSGPALIISRSVIKGTDEAASGSRLVGPELNKAGSEEAADWLPGHHRIYWVRTL